MKLIRYGKKGEEKPGICDRGIRFDCSAYYEDWNRAFFTQNRLGELYELVKNQKLNSIDPAVRWASPIARPGMILCVGLNYSDHAAESGMAVPSEPILFMKPTNTISGPYDEVTIPKMSTKTDWEVELGIVIGKDASYLNSEKEAEDVIYGYCIVHDVSERSFQLERGGQWVKGKSAMGFTPTGPYLVTKDEIKDVNNLSLWLGVDGQVMQSGNTNTMIFSPSSIVQYVSQFMQLEAGDLISTGTPPGVGMGMKPPRYLKDGETVTLRIESLGEQKQRFHNWKGD